MDNYYSSPELFEELYYSACGTVHSIRKGYAINDQQNGCKASSIPVCLEWSFIVFEVERCQKQN